MAKKSEKISGAQAAASAAAPTIAAAHDASAAEAGAQAPANNAPRAKPDDAEAAERAAASGAPAEFINIGWPLPDDIQSALAQRPQLAEHVRLVVKARPERGRWRAGRSFSREETVIPLADLTDAEIDALVGDPELMLSARVPAKPPA